MRLPAVTLRLARAADAAAMAAMSRDLVERGLGWRYSHSRIEALRRNRETVALAASDDHGAVQGFAVMQFGEERAHLVLLAVLPSRQRQGLGRRLLEWLLASCRVAGIAAVDLELRADNAGAEAFYRALGFTETALVPGYYASGVAARRMAMTLRPG